MDKKGLNALFYAKKESVLFPVVSGQIISNVTLRSDVREAYELANNVVCNSGFESVKINYSFKLLETLLLQEDIALYESAAGIYYESSDGIFGAWYDGNGLIRTNGQRQETIEDIACIMTAYMLSRNGNKQMQDIAQDILTGKVDVFSTVGRLATFSDAFYYGHLVNLKNFEIRADLTEEEIAAALTKSQKLEKIDEVIKLRDSKRAKKRVKKSKETIADTATTNVPWKWDEERKLKIQPKSFLESFVPNAAYSSLVRLIKKSLDKTIERFYQYSIGEQPNFDNFYEGIGGAEHYADLIGDDYINALIVGKPGTGKTTVAHALSATLGLPIATYNCSHNTDETFATGITTIVDGKPSFQRTDFLDIYENGGIIVLEEINLPNPAVMMGSLSQAIEYPFLVKENGFKNVRRHPMCVIIGTMNVGTEGSKPLNEAFANRFQITYTINDPSEEELVDILEKKTKSPRKICQWTYDAYICVLKELSDPDLDCNCDVNTVIANLSLRTCQGCLRALAAGDSAEEALENTFIGSIARVDLELAKDVKNAIKDVLVSKYNTI